MQTILIVDDDHAIADALAGWLESPGRELILCSDLESAQLVIERKAPSCVITDVRLSGPFRFEGLDFLADIQRHAPHSRTIVMTGALADGLEIEARRRGAYAVLQKPFELAEIDALLPQAALSEEPPSIGRIASIDQVIASAHLSSVFQPIVELSAEPHAVHGYEALARFQGELLSNPQTLFDYAARRGRLVDLELACVRGAFARGQALAASARLFLNIHPLVITSDRLGESLSGAAQAAGVTPDRVVLEITEQGSLGDSSIVERQCEDLRGRGFSFALDDMGMAYSHLVHIEKIRPSYLKVSQDFGTDFETDTTRTKIVRNLLSLARDFGCDLILEGVESAGTRDAARDLGIRLGQGYFFSRPAPAERFSAGAS